jgi:menaquinone-dependent protoporphyrinogen IX oxidase
MVDIATMLRGMPVDTMHTLMSLLATHNHRQLQQEPARESNQIAALMVAAAPPVEQQQHQQEAQQQAREQSAAATLSRDPTAVVVAPPADRRQHQQEMQEQVTTEVDRELPQPTAACAAGVNDDRDLHVCE